MDVEGVEPLHLIPVVVSRQMVTMGMPAETEVVLGIDGQIFVRKKPNRRRAHRCHQQKVEEHRFQNHCDEVPEGMVPKKDGVNDIGNDHQSQQNHYECGVVAGELAPYHLPGLRRVVHSRRRHQQTAHLPEGVLKVHLRNIQDATEVFPDCRR